MQDTISLLPVSLSLVHVPRSRLPHLSHQILRQILYPSPGFLNITCNEIELSLFAEHHLLEDFEEIARKDYQKQRSRSRLSKRKCSDAYEAIEISYEKWSVLQIDSHSDRIEKSGARVHELSAPLAAAGISILYQSSYMSDFIFVKECRLQEAMNHFASAGFNLYSSDPSPFTTRPTSPSLSPGSDDRSSIHDFTPVPCHSPKTVLTRSRSGTGTSVLSQPRQDILKEPLSPESTSPRSKAHSPTSGEVRILHPDLACVGWSDELAVDSWGLKIIKLVAFPDLIPLSPQRPSSPPPFRLPNLEPFAPVSVSHGRPRPLASSSSSSSASEDDDGYFSHSPQSVSVTSLDSSASRSHADLPGLTCPSPLKPPSKHPLSPETPLSPRKATRSHPTLTQPPTSSIRNEVLFFSFTRTQEGSSLTADVHVLASLFPPNERHMVMCSGELDAADASIDTGDSSDDDEDCDTPSPRKCLQLDLRRFGLNKHGLVNHFSRVLEENGINHMYSSTFKTANLLVEKKHAIRAQRLLRVC